MPISKTNQIIPFVNRLEAQIIELEEAIKDWEQNKRPIMSAINVSKEANNRSVQALTKVDEALAEISNATFGISADRNYRLKRTLDQLKSEIKTLVESGNFGGGGSGSGGALTEGEMYEELNNAISNVDSSVHPGLKLDFILNDLQDQVEHVRQIRYKKFILPTKHVYTYNPNQKEIIPREIETRILEGEVIALKEDKVILNSYGGPLQVEIRENGELIYLQAPDLEKGDEVIIFYQLERELEDIPTDAAIEMLDLVVKKNDQTGQELMALQEAVDSISDDIEAMKGRYWTPDFSIMQNHLDLSKELLTPKGLNIREGEDGKTILSFSYVDHPALKYFEAEYYDEEAEQWKPIDNDNDGVILK